MNSLQFHFSAKELRQFFLHIIHRTSENVLKFSTLMLLLLLHTHEQIYYSLTTNLKNKTYAITANHTRIT